MFYFVRWAGLIPHLPASLCVASQRRRVARPPAGGAQVPMLPGAGGLDEVSDPAVLGPHDQTVRLQAHQRLQVPSLRHTEIKLIGSVLEEGNKGSEICLCRGKSFFSSVIHYKNYVSHSNNLLLHQVKQLWSM